MMNHLYSNIRRRLTALQREDGFGIVEALIAAVILVIAVLAIFSAYDSSTRGTYRAQQSQVGLGFAQKELERLHGLSYDQVALSTAPSSSPDADSPDSRVQGTQFAINRTGTPDYAGMVIDPAGAIDPGPDHIQSGNVSGNIYRYVVSATDGGQTYRRVIIAFKPDENAVSQGRGYFEIHSDFTDPNASTPINVTPDINPPPPNPGSEQLFLTDTPCDPDGSTVRQPITGNHPLHNTLGSCSNGLQTGHTPGAPDALLPTSAPGNASTPEYDYDTTYEPQSGGSGDKGIQILPTRPCPWKGQNREDEPPDMPNAGPEEKFHAWVTDPMPTDFHLDGRVDLHVFSKTVNGIQSNGKFCFWIYKEAPDGTDTSFGGSAGTPNWTFHYIRAPGYFGDPNGDGNGYWPDAFDYKAPFDGIPDQIEPVPGSDITDLTNGNNAVVPAGYRLGVGISAGSNFFTRPPSAVPELMYDHPLFPARLEVETPDPVIPGN